MGRRIAWRLGPALLAAWLGACRPQRPMVVLGGPTMGTTYTVKLVAPPTGPSPATLEHEIEGLLAALSGALSNWDPASELSRMNDAGGTEWTPVSAELAAVVAAARAVSEWSGGAFDVTIAPLVDLWGFGPGGRHQRPPSAGEIGAARARVGYRRLEVREHPAALRKQSADLRIDLSAIAPGYAVDRIAALLAAHGIGDYLVELGGELRAAGTNADGMPWRIGVERPDTALPAVERVLVLRDEAVATSGDYRRYFEREGRRYAHVVDPRTGAPVEHAPASVTVLAPTATEADALATALLVLGPEDGLRLARGRDLAALFLLRERDGLVERASPAFERRLAATEHRA